MKKGDILVIASVLVLALASGLFFILGGSSGQRVIISQNNEELYSLSLNENKTVELSGNTVEIKNGRVEIKNATCKDRLCVKHKAIENKGESIICLPNKVIVEIR